LAVPLKEKDCVFGHFMSGLTFNLHQSGKLIELEKKWGIKPTQYLADKHGKFTHKAGTVERAKQDSFTHLALDELDGALWWAAKNSFALPEDLRSDKAAAACEYDYKRGLGHLEARLGDNRFATGDEFTVPDLIIAHCMGWGINVMKWIPPKGPLRDYLARVRERPAFQTAWAKREAAPNMF
ncbi:MAG: hypothetical protein AAFW74_10350, partial [Pseudomonadota bacterium]